MGEQKPEIVCLCGSTRFKDAYRKTEAEMALGGIIVLSCGLFSHADGIELTVDQKLGLDMLHLHKIALADRVHVLNVGGYIGTSTRIEVATARKLGKRVTYLEAPDA